MAQFVECWRRIQEALDPIPVTDHPDFPEVFLLEDIGTTKINNCYERMIEEIN